MSDQIEAFKAALADRYVIDREVGAGGMATVYRARDLKHERHVAIKVLRPDLAAVLGAERFLSEIKVTAHLQHPHILPLHDSGSAGGWLYYVMPFVDGESLRAKLNRETQLPIGEAIKVTEAVASALEYAHRHGVIHRDIKPENILLQEGEPMVADFGIALAVRAAGGARLTESGLSLGTPQYMSPEQATGNPELDARSDIYSLGAVLFEMLAGEPPHTGPTAQAVIAKVVTDRPRAIRQLRDTVPHHVEDSLAKALAKVPADRFPKASEFADAVTGRIPIDAMATVSPATPASRPVAVRPRWVPFPWAAAIVALAVVAWVLVRSRPSGEQPVNRYDITLPVSASLAIIGSAPLAVPRPSVAVSPDGSHIAYVAETDGETHLYVRPLDRYEARRLAGTHGAYHPFFSPDGEWIGFFVGNELKKIPRGGGSAVTVATTPNPYGATWVSGDRIVVCTHEGQRLSAVDAAGGPLEVLAAASGNRHAWPEALPGGNDVLVSGVGWDDIAAVSLATGERTAIGVQGWNPRFLGSGYLVYLGSEGLQAVGFDPERLAVIGHPVPLPEPVAAWGVAHAAISSDGMLVYAPGRHVSAWQFRWQGLDGTTEWLDLRARPYQTFALSADGRRLAYTLPEQPRWNIWVRDLLRGSDERLTVDGGQFPAWLPDSRAIAYSGVRQADDVVVTILAGRASARLFEAGNLALINGRFSDDGKRIAFDETNPDSSWNVWVAERTTEWTIHPVATSRFGEWGGAISPDGRWVAYTTDETGEYQVYVQPFPPTGERYPISTQGGSEEPVWSRDGAELYYRNGRRWMRLRVRTGPAFRAAQPELLFQGDYINIGGRSYDVAPDGRFLVLAAREDPEARSRLRVVTNWGQELQRLVGERNP